MTEPWSYVLTGPARRDLRRMPLSLRQRLFTALDRLVESQSGDLRKLAGEQGWALRVGDYRVIFERNPGEGLLTVLRVLHRREAYRRR